MKLPPQNTHSKFPSASQILTEAQRSTWNPLYLSSIPPSLQHLANELVDLQLHLNKVRDEYDYQRLTESVKVEDLNRQETLLLKRLERDRKIQKEREKIGKSLRGWEKKEYKKTGKLMEERKAEMMDAFLLYLKTQEGEK